MAGSTGPVETKVTASTAVALLASIGIAVLNAVVADSSLLGGLPPVLQALILAVVPTLIVFLGGYAAPHTNRSDPDAQNVGGPPPGDSPYQS